MKPIDKQLIWEERGELEKNTGKKGKKWEKHLGWGKRKGRDQTTPVPLRGRDQFSRNRNINCREGKVNSYENPFRAKKELETVRFGEGEKTK